jgi:CPA2 family monovalent cation:H+ antiporter-2
MKNAGLDFVVVDQNQETVEPIRQSGEHAIVGDARHRGTLEEALIGKARAIVVAVPDIYEAQRIVKIAREMNPNISILTRARNDKEFDFYKEQNVEHVVIGVKEIAARMMEQLQKYKIT